MDIYSYLNSPDVAEHCRRIGHSFNAVESAFIINDCRRISIAEKHRLYREIMETMPDMEIPNPHVFHEKNPDLSLFHQLEKLIAAEERILYRMHTGREGWFYSYRIAFADSDCVTDYEGFYSTYDKAVEAAKTRLQRFSDSCPTVMIEQLTTDSEKTICVYLNADFEISFILPESVNDEDFYSFLYELWVYIPTPFKKGDLVCGVNGTFVYPTRCSQEPMVLHGMCCWNCDAAEIERMQKHCDSSDMTAYGWWLDPNGHIYDEFSHSYYNLTYYTGETEPIKGEIFRRRDYRLLTAISAFLQKKININMLLIANDAIRAERNWNDSFPGWDYVEEEYDKAGITDIRLKRDLLREFDKKRREEKK